MAEQLGTGKITFAGQNLNNAPYYAHLAQETKYWFLDGLESTQFVVDPMQLVSTKPYLKSWVINTVLRIEPPDGTRTSMLSALSALAGLLDPLKGEQQLIFDEFPDSYFLAKLQKSTLSNEATVPYMVDVNIEFACTGPAYSMFESVYTQTTTSSPATIIVTSNGDSKSQPRYRLIAGGTGWGMQNQTYSGDVSIANVTTGEKVTWNGILAFGDVLDVILDPDYGTPYSVFKNGQLSISTVTGPAWPHIVGGYNTFTLTGPRRCVFEARWRDRFLIGQQSVGISTPLPTVRLPTELAISIMPDSDTRWTIAGYVYDTNHAALIDATIYVHSSTDNVNWTLAGTTKTNANSLYDIVVTEPTGTHYFRTYYPGSSGYLECFSLTVKVESVRQPSMMNLAGTKISGNYYQFSGTVGGTPNYSPRISSGEIWLLMAPDNASWDLATENVAYPDTNGNYSLSFTIPKGKNYYRTQLVGDLAWANSQSNSITLTGT